LKSFILKIKKMKKSIISIGLVALMTVSSCSDKVLDLTPENKVLSSQFFQTQADAVSATNQIYTNLREWGLAAFAPLALLNIASDDVDKGSAPADASFMNDYKFFKFTSTEGQIGTYWGGQFGGVNLCNQVITNVPKITMDANLKSRLIAEARFFRAYHYFNLVRTFGGVPIFDGLRADGNFNQPRNSVEEVYAFIQKDLQESSAILPQKYSASETGRATKGAALSLLAKTYLYQKNWAKAKETTETVMTMGYDLFPDYYKMFRIENENSVESILEVQCGGDNNLDVVNYSQYGEVQGVRGQFGWGFGTPSEGLIKAYEKGDKRKDASILYRGTTTPEGDFIEKEGDNPYYNFKVYVPMAQQPNVGSWQGNQNVRLIRFAEILLINAEANNELGNTAAAATSINRLRKRAGLANTTATTQDAMKTAIKQERRVELAMEWDRFHDLVRTGDAERVLGPQGFKKGKNELYPIPDSEITLSRGILTQNPGY
jgi:starch-binding outer membrane protein, SusD/RagB family